MVIQADRKTRCAADLTFNTKSSLKLTGGLRSSGLGSNLCSSLSKTSSTKKDGESNLSNLGLGKTGMGLTSGSLLSGKSLLGTATGTSLRNTSLLGFSASKSKEPDDLKSSSRLTSSPGLGLRSTGLGLRSVGLGGLTSLTSSGPLKGLGTTTGLSREPTLLSGLPLKSNLTTSSLACPLRTTLLKESRSQGQGGDVRGSLPEKGPTPKKEKKRKDDGKKKKDGRMTVSKLDKQETNKQLQSDIELPTYDLCLSAEVKDIEKTLFVPPEQDAAIMLSSKVKDELLAMKCNFINAVSASLIGAPDFKKPATWASLRNMVETVARYDPEFILKVALYTRKCLNIRTTANFLLALASFTKECRIYIKKYFSASINLPSDWIEVAEYYQLFDDSSIKFGSLPAALRRAMVAKFPDFDKYQLAKYNKEKSKKKKQRLAKAQNVLKQAEGLYPRGGATMRGVRGGRGRGGTRGGRGGTRGGTRGGSRGGRGRGRGGAGDNVVDVESGSDSDGDEDEMKIKTLKEKEREKKTFTLKQLIRKLHITEPVDNVMALIGKKYPSTLEEFYKCRLPGTWEEEKAGKRMKLPTPETWETQVSLKGNKAATWEDLLDKKKLPFMAMLRNLRNMIDAGISKKHHGWVLKKLGDENAVSNSKQFPFRFFSAYEVLRGLEENYEKNQAEIIEMAEREAQGLPATDKKRRPKRTKGKAPTWQERKEQKQLKQKKREVPYDLALLTRYKKALDSAVKIATVHNVTPIKGTTVIFCHLGLNMPCTSARGLGAPRTVSEIAVLMGLMCKYACEECTMIVYGNKESYNYRTVELEKGTILDNMQSVLKLTALVSDSSNDVANVPVEFLEDMVVDKKQIDNMLILSANTGDDGVPQFLKRYRNMVNANLLFVDVMLIPPKFCSGVLPSQGHPNDISIAGYSDQILRFIAERGHGGQLLYVEKIDTAFNLKPMPNIGNQTVQTILPAVDPQKLIPIKSFQPRWRTLRVFISSTFKDMHGERDLLTRFVFPELRAKAMRRFINIYEVDLRWGITEEETKSNKAMELCLSEIKKCHFFLGLLGHRYGWMPEKYNIPDDDDFGWIREYPIGASLTELEMEMAALCPCPWMSASTAFFYLRDHEKLDIPKALTRDFQETNEVTAGKVKALRQRIRNSGFEVYDGYPCHWGGVAEGKPVVAGLEDFGARVLNNLWNAVMYYYPDDGNTIDETEHENQLQLSFMDSHCSVFVGRKALIKKCAEEIDNISSGVYALHGKPGCGKSAFLAWLLGPYLPDDVKHVAENSLNLIHFVGASPTSAHVVPMLKRFCEQIKRRCGLDVEIPNDYKNLVIKFDELLTEGVRCLNSPILIALDGVDLLEDVHQARNMEWIPNPLPKNVLVVVTCLTDGDCHKALLRREGTGKMEIPSLELLDKQHVVRSHLSKHRKTLDESPFNNQMKLLVSKKEANVPLYLTLACEELRVFGVFEKISDKLKSMPHTVSQLLQVVLERLESDLGVDLVTMAMSLLTCARNGLMEHELHSLLSYSKLLDKKKKWDVRDILLMDMRPEQELPLATFAQLLRALQGFLRTTNTDNAIHLMISHADINRAVRQRYMKSFTAEQEANLHRLMAAYFLILADPDNCYSFDSQHGRAFQEFPYHLTACGDFDTLTAYLCNLQFIQAKCQLGLAHQLLEDFQVHGVFNKNIEKERQKFLSNPEVEEYRSFVGRNLHILQRFPALTIQQATNEPIDSVIASDADEETCFGFEGALMRYVNRPSVVDPCYLTISNLQHIATSLSISHDGHSMACGSVDGVVRLYDMQTGRELKTYTGHSDAITGVCFTGSGQLCSTSADKNVSLWDVGGGFRTRILKGHKRHVSACASDPKGKIVASASWDCSVRLWKVDDGSLISGHIKDDCPFNCVAFHPELETVVTGGWDATLKIWDVYFKGGNPKKGILRGHNTSVRDVRFSPSGRHLASAALDGEVRLWSASNGSPIATITGHSLPINRICFSPTGQELVTVSDDSTVKVWSGNLGKPVCTLGEEEFGPVTCVSLDCWGEKVAAGYHSGHIRMFDILSGAVDQEWNTVHTASVRCIKLIREGTWQTITTGSDDCLVSMIDLEENDKSIASHKHNTKGVWSLDIQLSYLATGSEDCSVTLYHYDAAMFTLGKYLSQVTLHTAPVTGCSFNENATQLATCSRDMSVIIWNIDGRKLQQDKVLNACHADWINSCCWSNTGNYLITSSNDFNLKMWDTWTGKEKTLFTGHQASVNAVSYSYGCIVSACGDGAVRVWSHKGTEITTLHGHSQRVNSCDVCVKVKVEQKEDTVEKSGMDWASIVNEDEWSNDHEKAKLQKKQFKIKEVLAVTCSDDGTVRVWKPTEANELACLTGHSDRVVSVDVAPDGKICTSSLDKSVKVWSPKLTQQSSHAAHEMEITCMKYCSQTGTIVTGSRDGVIKVWCGWDHSTHFPKCIFSKKASEKAITGVCFYEYEGSFATCSYDGDINMWKHKERPDGLIEIKFLDTIKAGRPLSSICWNHFASNSKKKVNAFLVSDCNGKIYTFNTKSWKHSVIAVNHDVMVFTMGFSSTHVEVLLSAGTGSYIPRCRFDKDKFLELDPLTRCVDENEEQENWIRTMEFEFGLIYLGDSFGHLIIYDDKLKEAPELIMRRKIHGGAITGIVLTERNIFTASSDKTIKVWDREGKQLGQFFSTFPVTSLIQSVLRSNSEEDSISLLCGDQLGNLLSLEWSHPDLKQD
ncbi:telomerase protein component 1-like [Lineus longissimus]|uniref:telomerase protein component 1-like n=1 Tax=Lineus longissimus TaxID=88925 RepID=UPI00315DCAF6